MAEIEIFSATSCPFAQRSRLILFEKGVAFTLREIDLEAKPDWFTQVSPTGKVPMIRHGGETIWESAVINEYLEEVCPTPSLMPVDAGRRAQARLWIAYADTDFTPLFYKLLAARRPDKAPEMAEKMRAVLAYMEETGLKACGADPYWLGEAPSLADFCFYPFFERWPAITHYNGLELPEGLTRLGNWLKAMRGRESVKATANAAEYYIRHYADYD